MTLHAVVFGLGDGGKEGGRLETELTMGRICRSFDVFSRSDATASSYLFLHDSNPCFVH